MPSFPSLGSNNHARLFFHIDVPFMLLSSDTLYSSVEKPLPLFHGFDSPHQATHPMWTPSSAHSDSDTSCQAALLCGYPPLCSQALTLRATSLLCRHLPHLTWAVTPSTGSTMAPSHFLLHLMALGLNCARRERKKTKEGNERGKTKSYCYCFR